MLYPVQHAETDLLCRGRIRMAPSIPTERNFSVGTLQRTGKRACRSVGQ